ncbi:MAG TPA: hypothetical protein PLT87_08835 [Spirochaetales bacterium]|nr:hypothetical protein [Spirochaetales bacterium]
MKKRMALIVVALALVLLLSSCMSISYPGKSGGLVANLEPQKYEILGEVKLEGTRHTILGIISYGGATYDDLLEKAKAQYQADDVINISLDNKSYAVLGVYISQTYVLRGQAIKYVK